MIQVGMELEDFLNQQDAERRQQATEAERKKRLKELEANRQNDLAISQQAPSLIQLVELFTQKGVPPVTLWYYDRAKDSPDPQMENWDIHHLIAIDKVWPCSYTWSNPDELLGNLRLSQCTNSEGKVYSADQTWITPYEPRSYSWRGTSTSKQGTKFHLVSPRGSLHVHEKVNERLHLIMTTSQTAQVWDSHNLESEYAQRDVERVKRGTKTSQSGPWLHPRRANVLSDIELLAMVYRHVTASRVRETLARLWPG